MGEWQEHIAKARSKGLLAKELYVVISTSTGDMDKYQANFLDHLAYQKELEQKGVLFAAGPFGDAQGHDMDGESLVIYRAKNLGEAKTIGRQRPDAQSWSKNLHIAAMADQRGRIDPQNDLL